MFKKRKLSQKLLIVGIAMTVIPLLCAFGFVFNQNGKSTALAKQESIKMADADLHHIVESINTLAKTQQEVIEKNLESSLNVAEDLLTKAGGFKFSNETQVWDATNQYTKNSSSIVLPKMYVGDTWLGKISSKDENAPLVDEVLKLVGTTCTVFQIMNPGGDMLRVATNVIKTNDQRAIGTYIPEINANGSKNKVISTIKQGQTYLGRAYVVNGWYLTAYKPMYDNSNKLVGMLYVGIPQESTTTLRNVITDMVIAKTGYVYVLDHAGNYIISQHGKNDGKNIMDAKDENGKFFIKELVAKATALGDGEIGDHTYQWKDAVDNTVKTKKIKFTYFKKWDWIIGAGSFEYEFIESAILIAQNAHKSNIALIILISISIFVTSIIWIVVARNITIPINRIIESLSGGAGQVASASIQISSSSQQLSEGASQQAAALEETSASMEEISSMTQQNAENASQADILTTGARQTIGEANESMVQLTKSMKDISEASEKTSNIIKTIDEIAFQTNLLALNAAVEAARAGEVGAGFAVVADEVRNLAMRAANAAKETAQLIESTVKKVNDGSELVSNTNKAFVRVSQSSEKVGNLVAEIAQASKEQTSGIGQISNSIAEMDKVVQLNAANAEESASGAEEMSSQAEQLKNYVATLNGLVRGKRNQMDVMNSDKIVYAVPNKIKFSRSGIQKKLERTPI